MARHRGDVDFLEGLRSDGFARHLPRDREHGNGIAPGIGDSCDEICRTGTRCGQAHTDFPACPRDPLGDEGRSLFVARKHMPDRRPVQRVVQWQDVAAGNAHHGIDPVADQDFKKAFRLRWFPWSGSCDADAGMPKRGNANAPRRHCRRGGATNVRRVSPVATRGRVRPRR